MATMDDYHAKYKRKTSVWSVRLVMVVLVLFTFTLISALGWMLFYILNDQARKQAEGKNQSINRILIGQAYSFIQTQKSMLDYAAKDPSLLTLFASGSTEELQNREKLLGKSIPHAWRVKLIKPEVVEPVLNVKPPITDACLYLKQQASETGKVIIDIHGAPRSHIDFIKPVHNKDKKIVGYILLTMKLRVLKSELSRLNVSGYIELQQKALGKMRVLLGMGAKKFRSADVTPLLSKIHGTPWTLKYWPGVLGKGMGQQSKTIYLAVIGGTAVILVFVLYAMMQMLRARVMREQNTIVNIVRDLAEGSLDDDYPNSLRDFQDTQTRVLQLGHSIIRNSGASLAKNAASIEEEFSLDDVEPEPEPETETENNDSSHEQQHDVLDSASVVDEPDDALEVVEEKSRVEASTATKVPGSVFRAYDIRGIVDKEFTAELVREIGHAIGSEALARGENKVVIGRDGRLSGRSLREALSGGLQAAGVEVIDVGKVPTPVTYYAALKLANGSGVMITGSHNPPNYNGLKIMLGGETLYGDTIQALRKRIETGDLTEGAGSEKIVEISADYQHAMVDDIKIKRPLKVVVDCGNGVAGNTAPAILKAIGCEVIEMYCEVDGTFPNHHPDPSKPENIAELQKAVKENQADLGVAFDGDGDRLGVVDNTGQVIWPDRTLMVLARDVLKRNPGAQIIYDVKCTRNLETIIKEHGGLPLMWKTGHSFIKAKIRETGALLAGEMSGHLFIKERWNGVDDAIYACARLLEVLSGEVRSSHQVFGELPDTVNTPELNIHMQEGEPGPFMSLFASQASFDGGRLIDIDGVRVEFDDGWGLVRASNTTPVLVMRFEADTEDALKRIQEQFRKQMLAVKPDLEMPY